MNRSTRQNLALLVMLIGAAPIFGANQTSSWSTFRRSFSQAHSVRPENLIGVWIHTRDIATHMYIDGRSGPDSDEYDPKGIRRPEVPGSPYDWRVTFEKTQRRIKARSDSAWEPTGDVSSVQFESDGSFVFVKDYGADEGPSSFRCRVEADDTLICLEKSANGRTFEHGVEFRRVNELAK